MKNIPIIFILTLFIISCKRDIPENKGASAIYTLKDSLLHEAVYAMETSDDGIILFSNSSELNLTKFNSSGKEIWRKQLPNVGASHFRTTNIGSVIIMSINGRSLAEIDVKGNVVFNEPFQESSIYLYYFTPYRAANGNFLVTENKGAPWFSDTNKVYHFTPDGKVVPEKSIIVRGLGNLGLSVGFLDLYQYEEPDVYYFIGSMYPYQNFGASPKLMLFRLEYPNGKFNLATRKKVDLDSDQIDLMTVGQLRHIINSRNELVIACNQSTFDQTNIGRVIKVDKDMNKVWDRQVRMNFGNTQVNSISACRDGGYLLTGHCNVKGKLHNQPFAMKIDQNGQTIWQQLYDFTANSSSAFGIQGKNENCFLFGNTTSFGAGLDRPDCFMIRTDANGKLK